MTDEEPTKSGNNAAAGCLTIIILMVLIGGAIAIFGGDDAELGGGPSTEDIRYGAFDVCTKFVKDQLKAQSTAEFPNEFEDDGEVIITRDGNVWTVDSQVDSENSFGGMVTTPFVCVVRHTGGTGYRLVDLTFDP